MESSKWVIFGEQGEYRANRSGLIQTRVRRGRSLDNKKGKKIVSDWVDLIPRKCRTDMYGGFYYCVNAGLNGKTTDRVHTIICNLFHGPKPQGKYEVDHIDGCRENNSAENLRWATHKENMENARYRGAWKKMAELSFPYESEEQFLAIMTQLNAGISHKEMERRYNKSRSVFSRLSTMDKQCGFVYRHRWLSVKIQKNDFFGGAEKFPLDGDTYRGHFKSI